MRVAGLQLDIAWEQPEANYARIRPWLAAAAASLIVPWALYLAVPSGMLPNPLAPAVLWKALWPVLLGATLAVALWRWVRRLPRVPEGDIVAAMDGGVKMALACGKTNPVIGQCKAVRKNS